MPKNKTQHTLSEVLREAVNSTIESGETFRSLEKQTGVLRQSIMLFARGERGLQLSKADALAAHFGLELRPTE